MRSALFEKHEALLQEAIKAIAERKFYTPYPDFHKVYGEENQPKGEAWVNGLRSSRFDGLKQDLEGTIQWVGEEQSPYDQHSLGISYPQWDVETYFERSTHAGKQWSSLHLEERTGLLLEVLDRLKARFFDLAYATMHTSGQSFMMAFQASGPHSSDRALEALALGYQELNRFPEEVEWVRPMGKHEIRLKKHFKGVPKGIGLTIGCSTFPVWNSIPCWFANLVAGNPVIHKAHPGAVLPAAIVIGELQLAMAEAGYDPHAIQLMVDTADQPMAQMLAEDPRVKLIDFTGNTGFGNYLESLPGKVTFTEKTGVNSVLLHSVDDISAVVDNLAFSVTLYSGQMCTTPQNFLIPDSGIQTPDGMVSYDEFTALMKTAVEGLVNHPKIGMDTIATIQNPRTTDRLAGMAGHGGEVLLAGEEKSSEPWSQARRCTPTLVTMDASDDAVYEQELFGPVVFLIRCKDAEEGLDLAGRWAEEKGMISFAAYTTDSEMEGRITQRMSEAFVSVSFNLTGLIWVNQAAAFSDFHLTGGNPSGNASFCNPEFVTKRFVWVQQRKLIPNH